MIEKIPTDLPGMDRPFWVLLVAVFVAALTGLARSLYGRHEAGWRYLLASSMMSGSLAMLIYAGAAITMPERLGAAGGYAAVFVGTCCGLFMEELLRRLRCYVERVPLRSPFGYVIERRRDERPEDENEPPSPDGFGGQGGKGE